MRILTRHLIKELIPSFLLGIVIFTFVFVMSLIVELAELVINRGINFWIVFQLFIYRLPQFLVFTIPMATLLAVLMVFNRLSSNREITALKTCGINILSLALPVIIIALILSISLVYFNDRVIPMANYASSNLHYRIIQEKAAVGIQEGIFNQDFEGLIILVNKKNPRENSFQEVLIRSEKGRIPYTIIAREGALISDPGNFRVTLKLTDGSIHHLDSRNPAVYHLITFSSYYLNLNLKGPLSKIAKMSKDIFSMTTREIQEKISSLRSQRKTTTVNTYLIELYKRSSIPFACLAFALFGIPLGMRISRGGKSFGFGISVILIIIYYILLTFSIRIGEQGIITPRLAMWFPDIFLGILGLILLRKINQG
jgi:lipopolysaccharide export system permease protein